MSTPHTPWAGAEDVLMREQETEGVCASQSACLTAQSCWLKYFIH